MLKIYIYVFFIHNILNYKQGFCDYYKLSNLIKRHLLILPIIINRWTIYWLNRYLTWVIKKKPTINIAQTVITNFQVFSKLNLKIGKHDSPIIQANV